MANRTTHRGHKKIRRALWDLIIHHVDSPDVTIEALEFENERQWRQQRRKLLNKLHRLRLWPILRWIAKEKIQRSLESNTGSISFISESECARERVAWRREYMAHGYGDRAPSLCCERDEITGPQTKVSDVVGRPSVFPSFSIRSFEGVWPKESVLVRSNKFFY
jgi:hypothetical protein